jgi:hypothetical protein
VIAISSDATPSAYAVQSRADGSVTVSINRLSDAAGLEQELDAAGVPAVVAYDAPSARSCMTIVPAGATTSAAAPNAPPTLVQAGATSSAAAPPAPGAASVTAVRVEGDSGPATITIDPADIPAGKKLFITTSTGAVGSIGMTIAAPGTAHAICALPVPSSASGSSTAAGSGS